MVYQLALSQLVTDQITASDCHDHLTSSIKSGSTQKNITHSLKLGVIRDYAHCKPYFYFSAMFSDTAIICEFRALSSYMVNLKDCKQFKAISIGKSLDLWLGNRSDCLMKLADSSLLMSNS